MCLAHKYLRPRTYLMLAKKWGGERDDGNGGAERCFSPPVGRGTEFRPDAQEQNVTSKGSGLLNWGRSAPSPAPLILQSTWRCSLVNCPFPFPIQRESQEETSEGGCPRGWLSADIPRPQSQARLEEMAPFKCQLKRKPLGFLFCFNLFLHGCFSFKQ